MLPTYIVFAVFISSVVSDYPFRNISLPWENRVNDLVDRLTLEELMLQMSKGGAGPRGGPAPAIDRLGIGPYSWNTECLRGDVQAGNATSFPQSIGLAATFSKFIVNHVASATGTEVRAKFNDYQVKKQYGDHKGISCFSPVINIMRHPLWGRNQETYGEDPYLSGELAGQFVKGLQGDHPRYIQANAGCKHFDVHGGPENIPVSRFEFDAKVAERDWRLTFLPQFRRCVEAGTYSLMCSYNSINGVPACANKKLLTEILRGEWDFKGYVVSDETAIENIILGHHYLNNSVDTVAACVKAGCNLELNGNNANPVYASMIEAVNQKKLTMEEVKEKAKPLFYTRMRLGEFDPAEINPYTAYNLSSIQSPGHQYLSLLAAMKSFVLLKNENKFLPLKKKFNKIALVGPMADNLRQLYGDYDPLEDPTYARTPRQVLSKLASQMNFAAGCLDANRCTKYNASDIKNAVQGTQLVIVCLGTGTNIESEGNDRSTMELPGYQKQLLQDSIQYGGGTPVLLLLFNAGPVNITLFDAEDRIPAILELFFPAQATGEALYNVLTLNMPIANPGGRLPYTWYRDASQIPSMTDYTMTGKTYRYFQGTPLYPFGYGLSYTSFSYSKLTYEKVVLAGDSLYLFGIVENTGIVDGDEVVQVYISWVDYNETMPNVQLVGFERFYIQRYSSYEYRFNIDPRDMAVWTDDKGFVVKPGTMNLYVGGQQPHQVRSVGSNVETGQFKIQGQKVLGKY